ncbi:MAG: CsiV family protein [Woeseiaceae bacterium]
MNTAILKTGGKRIVATFAIVIALLPVAASGQQATVPGVTALESEAEEEIRRYAVELIIFEYTDRASAGSEVFLPDVVAEPTPEDDFFATVPGNPQFGDMRQTDNAGPLDASGKLLPGHTDFGAENERPGDLTAAAVSAPPAEPIELAEIPTYEQAGLVLLSRKDYVLNDVYEQLARLDAYRPIMHTAWSQKTLEKEATLPIALRRLGNPPLRLEGSMSLYLSRFLHLVVDLSLAERSPLRPTAENNRVRSFGDNEPRFGFDREFITPTVYYRIEEDRIVRNGELRYYDHPRFGVVAKITRVEESETGQEGQSVPNAQ